MSAVTAGPESKQERRGALRRRLLRSRELLVSYALALALLIAFAVATPGGWEPQRILTILGQNAQLGIAAIGQTVVLLSGGLDLSIGPVMNLASVTSSAQMRGQDGNIVQGIAVALAAGGFVGLVNGLLVARAKIPPLLATLAVGTIVQGGYYVYTEGQPKGGVAPGLQSAADAKVFGSILPWWLVLWLAVWAVVAFLLYRTTWGRRFYAAGASPRASWLSGVAVSRYVVGAYVLSGLCAAIAGVALTAYTGSPSVSGADSYTLQTVAAAVIGGVAFSGGIGRLAGAFAGVAVLVFLTTILETLNVDSAVQYVVQGAVLIGMMLVNRRLSGRGSGSAGR
jgi:ribose transport system permease protein